MTAVRWIAILPDPTTGFDTPVIGGDGKPFEWLAPDKRAAAELAKNDLTPNQLRLASIVSVVEFESRTREPHRKVEWSKKSFQHHRRGGR